MKWSFLFTLIMVFVVCLIGSQLQVFPAHAQNNVDPQTNVDNQNESIRILLLGSSFIRAVNSDDITNYLNNNGAASEVYHLGVDMDLPSRRIHNLNDVIALDPDLIIYGVGHRIGINDGTHEQRYGCMVIKQSDVEYPRGLSNKKQVDEMHSNITNQNKDFKNDLKNEDQKILAKYIAESVNYEPLSDIKIINLRNDPKIDTCSEFLIKEVANLKEILRILKDENGIEVTLFVTPHPKAYLDRIEDFAEDYNLFLLQSIGYEYGVDVYDISHKYEEEDIFRDFVHVARNSKSEIYSNDISKIILNSIKNKAPYNDIERYKVTIYNNPLLSQWCEDNNNNLYIESKCYDSNEDPVTFSNVEIPAWIRNNAAWWTDGQIGDSAFVQGIQYLIKEGIMKIPPTTEDTSSDSNEIPAWIKTNTKWWSEGQIDDETFINGIQYLVKNSIIKI